MAASANINQDNTKMDPLLEKILMELKANQPSSPPDKKGSTRSNSTQVPPIPSAKIMKIYENDQVKCRRNDGVVESLLRRIGTVEEQERWSSLVGNASEVPEDGRLKLTFSKRSLLSLSSDTALKMLEEIHKEDRNVPKWFNGERTRIVDIFDDKTTKIYTIDPDASNMIGVGNIARSPIACNSQSQVTSTSVNSDPSPEVRSDPWRRIISIWAPYTKSRCLVRDLNVSSVSSKQGRPNPGSGFEDRYSLDRTFYEIVTIPVGKIKSIPWNFWNNGVLHTESNDISSNPRSLQATSFLACPSISGNKYWTLLEMNPATFAYTSDSIEGLTSVSRNMLLCVFFHAYTAISQTAIRWKQILKYFDQSIGDKLTFLDPNYHDMLLSDDEVLSRSKKYCWAISTLKELRTSMSQNILQIRQLIEQETSETTTEEESKGLRRVRAMLCSELREIENIASKLETKQEEATCLRDGLISANSLVETRNSTRFNQNIKLLTCVSILFLALSFCMSGWSIDSSFGYLNLLLTANLLAAATYFLVLHAHRLVLIFQDVYHKFIRNTLEAMKKDEDEKWATRARELIKYSELSEEAPKHSHWIYFSYTLRRLCWLPWLKLSRRCASSV
ncbi:hypothetical protein BCON_0085g00020 [Botryotinia convoluta]|uniref:Uncharacterized protein n=1 Tax=Botryotinia convoluta TaxID=54673 RepID=A0A4Z1I8S3_9HELO|nr:hypothetical protein BCON_0085g00020 [Botryotinia convoluta]